MSFSSGTIAGSAAIGSATIHNIRYCNKIRDVSDREPYFQWTYEDSLVPSTVRFDRTNGDVQLPDFPEGKISLLKERRVYQPEEGYEDRVTKYISARFTEKDQAMPSQNVRLSIRLSIGAVGKVTQPCLVQGYHSEMFMPVDEECLQQGYIVEVMSSTV